MRLLSCSRAVAFALLVAVLGAAGGPLRFARSISDDGVLQDSTVQFMTLVGWSLVVLGVALIVAVVAWRSSWNRDRRERIATDFSIWQATDDKIELGDWTRRFNWQWTVGVALAVGIMGFASLQRDPTDDPTDAWTEVFLTERGLTENFTALMLLGTSILTAASTTRWCHRNWLLTAPLGFAVMFFLAAGEEASWGQHWLKFSTPDALAKVNSQGEMNLHNLYSYAGNLSMDLLFFAFVAIHPVLRHGFADVRYLCDRLQIPKAPLVLLVWPFAMLFLTQGGSRLWLDAADYNGNIQEVREAIFGLVMFASAVYTYRAWKDKHAAKLLSE